MDSEHTVSYRHRIFDVILDKTTAGAPVLKNHKGLEVCSKRKGGGKQIIVSVIRILCQ